MMGSTLLKVLCLFGEALFHVWSRSKHKQNPRPGAVVWTELERYLPERIIMSAKQNTHDHLDLWLSEVCLITGIIVEETSSKPGTGDTACTRRPAEPSSCWKIFLGLLSIGWNSKGFESTRISSSESFLLPSRSSWHVRAPKKELGWSRGSSHHYSSWNRKCICSESRRVISRLANSD